MQAWNSDPFLVDGPRLLRYTNDCGFAALRNSCKPFGCRRGVPPSHSSGHPNMQPNLTGRSLQLYNNTSVDTSDGILCCTALQSAAHHFIEYPNNLFSVDFSTMMPAKNPLVTAQPPEVAPVARGSRVVQLECAGAVCAILTLADAKEHGQSGTLGSEECSLNILPERDHLVDCFASRQRGRTGGGGINQIGCMNTSVTRSVAVTVHDWTNAEGP